MRAFGREPGRPAPRHAASPGRGPSNLLSLQRLAGNRAVGRLLGIQDETVRGPQGAPSIATQAFAPGTGDHLLARDLAQVSGSRPPITVSRLMSADDFRGRTQVGRFAKRGDSIDQVEQDLAAYHRVARDDYAGRAQRLTALRQTAQQYGTRSKSGRHQDVVDDLLAEVDAARPIYQALATASGTAANLARARALLAAQEDVLAELDRSGAGPSSELSFVNVDLATLLNHAVNALTPAEMTQLVGDDLAALAAIRADPAAPAITRDLLGDLLGHQGDVHFTTGMPGTSLSALTTAQAPEKYTLKHMMSQSGGATERLGSLAHELTHVDAGETYGNTEILVLARRNLTDPEITGLATTRRAEIDTLDGLLTRTPAVAGEREQLVRSKLHYAVDPMKGVGRYAAAFKNRIDPATHRRLLEIEALSKPNSSALVEYDTIITQILVYLHRWDVDQADPFYAEVRRVADGLRTDRQAAAAAPTGPTTSAAGTAPTP